MPTPYASSGANPLKAVKHAPRWAWFTVAGVGVGALAVRMFQNRATDSTDSTDVTDTTVPATDAYGQAVTTSPSPVSTVVPSVVVASPSDEGGTGIGEVVDAYVGGISDLIGNFGTITSALVGNQVDVNSTLAGTIPELVNANIDALANAGSAPTKVAPVVVTVAAPAKASAPVAAPPKGIRNTSAALSAINAAISSAKNSGVKANLQYAKAHIQSNHPDLALQSLSKAVAAGADSETTKKINVVRQYV